MSGSDNKEKADRALLRFLQRHGRVSAADTTRLQQRASQTGLSISEVLEQEGIITEKDLAALLAQTLRLPLVDLASFPLDPEATREVKEGIATKYQVVPLRLEERVIEVATANPLDLDALRAVEFAMGRRTQVAVATRLDVRDALSHAYRLEESLDQFLQNVPASEPLTVTELKDNNSDLRTVVRDAELPPVVRLADLILVEGIKGRASDIHLEPCSDGVAVRNRIDGVLEERFRFPKWVQNPLIARFKVLAKLDITERRVPQDGRIQVRHEDRLIDLRVSSMPAQHGEKITLRILDATRGVKTLDKMGLTAIDMERMRDAVGHPEGIVLVTGPTGSGKTTTLYALIQAILSPTLNIVTIENPIEYQIRGVTQVEVNVKQGLTFASVLRSILRQDPDVILVGEIRDQETAQIAFRAAQTGHLVLSTLHTNDAVATVTRLLDLGIEPYVLASSLNLIIAQRLIRQVCLACSAPYEPPEESRRLLRLDDYRREFRRGLGCPACRHSGYAGRIGVFELLPISPAIAQLIEAGTGESAIRRQARAENYPTLLEDALGKLAEGLTTPEEVLRVVQINESSPRCPTCQEEVEGQFSVCPHCSGVLRAVCSGCGKALQKGWLTCPHCGAQAVSGKPASPAASPAGSTPPVPSQRTFKALVVDDDPDLRRIARITLERSGLGLTVLTAQDGTEALNLIDIERPDIVILDLSMPLIDGFEVCRRLRADPRTAAVPILMLTATDGAESVTRGFQDGVDDYVVKPFRREDFIARVRRMIERTYGAGAIGGAEPGAVGQAGGSEPSSSGRAA
ncbi:MAG: ATPase, T2SS/T4P/T4SS family [Candidatus Binatia bacterium]